MKSDHFTALSLVLYLMTAAAAWSVYSTHSSALAVLAVTMVLLNLVIQAMRLELRDLRQSLSETQSQKADKV